MKTLLALLAAAGLAGAALAAENWTKDQQEIVKVFDRFADAMKSGDASRTVETTDPNFTAWDFEASAPMDRAAFQKFHADFFAQWKIADCTLTPVAIHIDRDLAIAHGTGSDTMRAADGTLVKAPANWSATLVRRHGQWLFLSWSWAATRPVVDEAVIKQEVAQAMQSLLGAFSRADIGGILGFYTDDPAFLAADAEGKVSDNPTFRKATREFFQTVSGEKIQTKSQDIRILDADTAIVAWQGGFQTMMKDGTAVKCDAYAATFLFKRSGQAWKIIYDHESGLPPQPVPSVAAASPTTAPAPSPENQKLAVWYGDWTYAGEYHATPLGAAGKLTGTMTGRPVQNGHAGEFIYLEKGPAGETKTLELDFWDPVIKDHYYIALGNEGYVERGAFSMRGNLTTSETTVSAEGKLYKIRAVETVAPDGLSFTKKMEVLVDEAWLPYSDVKYTKVAAKP